ncbi:MAG: GxxExxY protein [Cyclobacteriaceae bacterium]|nr:GxxExxY protein [Cyclobacteriaceae bacterium]
METALLLENETYEIIGVCMAVHRELGHGFLEIVYKDAIQFELASKNITFGREVKYDITYKNTLLSHKFYADFTVNNRIILEVKAAEGGIADHQVAQAINYLRVSG